jgi:hypothetical protein
MSLENKWEDLVCPNCEQGDYTLVQDGDECLATCSYCSPEYKDWPMGHGTDPESAIADYVSCLYFIIFSPRAWTVDPDKPPPIELPS